MSREPTHSLQTPTERMDERDTMFARMARVAGTPPYEDYYAGRPELQRSDDRLRRMPALCQPGGLYYHPTLSRDADRYFGRIEELEIDDAGVERRARRIAASPDPDGAVRELVRSLGAVAVGATALDPAFIYTRKGRLDGDYGEPVTLDHPTALVFLVEMEHGAMERAPRAEVALWFDDRVYGRDWDTGNPTRLGNMDR